VESRLIISHKHQFIFIKTRKTAGTSIEISLSRYCQEQDIITPISQQDEKIRMKIGNRPQNQGSYFNHISAKRIKEMIGDDIWNSYYKFCFDRNPWDKVVSYYYYICKPKKVPFHKFMESGQYKRALNYPLYSIQNEVAVDYLGSYENLEEDLEEICTKVGIPFDGWLPKAKGNFRSEHQNYQDFYNEEHKKLVQQYYKREIEVSGYEF
jgi:hypothetical protein